MITNSSLITKHQIRLAIRINHFLIKVAFTIIIKLKLVTNYTKIELNLHKYSKK